MTQIVIYSTDYCPYCDQAKALLHKKGLSFQEIRVDLEPEKKEEMIAKSGRKSVPQIFINDRHIGGCDDLYALHRENKLDELL